MSIHQQIAESRAEIRRLKESNPWLFSEYHQLQHAEQQLAFAKDRLKKARAEWRKLGTKRTA